MVGMRLAVMKAAEECMRRMYREHVCRMWVVRGVVFMNLTVIAWDLNAVQGWVQLISVLPMWGAWHAFCTGERFAGDLPQMRAALADVREKIKTAKGLANES